MNLLKRNKETRVLIFIVLVAVIIIAGVGIQPAETVKSLPLEAGSAGITWKHLSTANNPPDLQKPSASTQQTAALVLDVDNDELNDLVVAIRKAPGPSMVWYKRVANGWEKYVIDNQGLNIEAGGDYYDIDDDGDLDIVMGGDYRSKQIWWWENPYPNYNKSTPWTRHLIKNSGSNKHHDQIFGDFDNNGKAELVFWNQSPRKLMSASIPRDPSSSGEWEISTIYTHPKNPAPEGLAKGDVDLDGIVDIVGGGMWFKYNGNGKFTANVIDGTQAFTRAAVGQLIKGGRPEVVFVAGDEAGPLYVYEWDGSKWARKQLLSHNVDHGHSLQLVDVNQDGNLDIFVAEMRVDGKNPDAKMWFFLGDGKGNFTTTEVASGYGNHESRVADLDGDGDYDILGKPYNWKTPRLDVWLNESGGGDGGACEVTLDSWKTHYLDQSRPARAIFVYPADLNGDGLQDVVSGGWWYQNPGTPDGTWNRKAVGSSFNNVAAVYDFNRDGSMDLLGTKGVGSRDNADFVWAQNDGAGNFTIRNNVGSTTGDFLQGVAVDEFVPGNIEVALSWHAAKKGIQMLDVPANPASGNWPRYDQISTTSQDEQLSSGDIDRDGDRDLLLGTKWLRNDAASSASNSWADYERAYRVLTTVNMNGTARTDSPAEVTVNFASLLSSAGASGSFDANSLRVVEVDGNNKVVSSNVPFQFDANGANSATGTLIILQNGQSAANAQRRYHVYFDVLSGQPASPAAVTPLVTLTDNVQDEGQSSYEIKTSNATYNYHKTGGGFSSLVDKNGNDWISYSKANGSAGDYRGIPNLVSPKNGGYFHPGRDTATSSIVSQGPLKVTIRSTSADKQWETMWEIYPNHAQLTVLKAAPSKSFWFLYEGTPGGKLDTATDFMVRSDGTSSKANTDWTKDLAGPEWIYFSDPGVNRSLYLVHHEDDSHVERYYAMEQKMTVFGFGRGQGTASFLTSVPSHFTLGLTDGTDSAAVGPVINGAYKSLDVSLGTAEKQPQKSESGPWSVQTLSNVGGDPDRNRLADINNDNRLDAVIGYEAISKKGKLAWYEQPANSTGIWTEHVIANDVIGPMSLDVGDLDGDGDVDVVIGEHNTNNPKTARVLIFENPGTTNGTWKRHVAGTGDEHHDGTQLVDIDNDGDMDIISIGWSHNKVILYENTGCTNIEPPVDPKPNALFSADKRQITPGTTVQFSDVSIGKPTAWSWNFGDGATSTVQNPSHTYNKAGTYNVSLTASNAAGSDTETKAGYITVGEAPSGGQQTFSSVADAWIHSELPAKNTGTWDNMKLRNDNEVYNGYVKFNVQGITTVVQQATLRLYVSETDAGGSEAVVHVVNDSGWEENGINWDNAPAMSRELGKTGRLAAGSWTEIDVTTAVNGNGMVSFGLMSAAGNESKISAKEGPQAAQLVVVYDDDAPPPGEMRSLETIIVGEGNVYRSPAQDQYADGSTVLLTAVPRDGYTFSGWSGDLSGRASPIKVHMDGDHSITATFAAIGKECQPAAANVLSNPSFEDGTNGWTWFSDREAGNFSTGGPAYDCEQAARLAFSSNTTGSRLYQSGITLKPDSYYVLNFAAYSNTGRDVAFFLEKAEGTGDFRVFAVPNLGTAWQTFTMPFKTGSDVTNLQLRFGFGGLAAAGDVYWIDKVSIIPIGQNSEQ